MATTDAKLITRANAEALIPTETSEEIIKNLPGKSAALSLLNSFPT